MSFFAVILLAGSAPVTAPVAAPQATTVAIARARVLSPAEARRVDGRLEVRMVTPTEVHRTARRDGGVTADFY